MTLVFESLMTLLTHAYLHLLQKQRELTNSVVIVCFSNLSWVYEGAGTQYLKHT